jgi:glucose-6-phosphate 1-dehydrogenase
MAAADANPLAAGLERKPAPPTTLVIFGATGDLGGRKLLPAIYNLAREGSLPDRFNLIGVARGSGAEDGFERLAGDAIAEFSRTEVEGGLLEALLAQTRFIPGSFDDPATYERLARELAELDEGAGASLNRLFYLSTAPEFFPPIVAALGRAGLHRSAAADVRVVIEKPFGYDLESAQALNRDVLGTFEERQIYRIDHYLGKETVQNMLAFRFANGMFEPVWNRNFVDHVQIVSAEEVGVGTRAAFYEPVGALRDLVQNHMLQLVALLCMEPPASFEAEKVRDEKVKVLEAIAAPRPDQVAEIAARGQYGPGVVGGEQVPGYLEEEGVAPDSTTETYAALKLEVSNWRWAGVPFYLRTGKRLARKLTEIAVTLKPVPHLALQADAGSGVQPNRLVMTIQPDEGVSLSLGAKVPGGGMRIRPVNMEFRYGTSFLSESPEAYERLILDALRGDTTLFTRDDEVEASWAVCDPILKAWSDSPGSLATYPAGSAGPDEAEAPVLGSVAWRPI